MRILDFPILRQAYEYDCGATALQSVLAYYGIEVREGSIMKIAGTNREYGTSISRIKAAIKKHGLKCISKEMNIDELKKFIGKNIPVIVLMQAWTKKKNVNWEKDWNDGHYAVIIGYDKSRLILADPSSFTRVFLKFREFSKRWHGKDRNVKKYANQGFAIYGRKLAYNSKKIVHMG